MRQLGAHKSGSATESGDLLLKSIILVFAILLPLSAQKLDPVQWELTSDTTKAPAGSTVVLKLTAKIQDSWHIYSATTPPPTIPSKAVLADNPALSASRIFQPTFEKKFDEALG